MGKLHDCVCLLGGDSLTEEQKFHQEKSRNQVAIISQYGLHDLRAKRHRVYR